MTEINIYSDDADAIELLSTRFGISVAEVVRVLLEYAEEAEIDGEFG